MADFKIGTTLGGMTSLESLTTPVPLPQIDFLPFARVVNLGDGGTRGVGSPVVTWTFQLLSLDEYNQLRTFCPGASAEIFIRTRIDDDTYEDFQARMVMPNDGQNRWFGNRKNFVVTFRNLVVAV
jgi:hypothetical protein